MTSIPTKTTATTTKTIIVTSTANGSPSAISGFFRRVREALLEDSAFSFREQTALVIFLIHCFNSVEVDMVRLEIQKLVSLSIWSNILPELRDAELK